MGRARLGADQKKSRRLKATLVFLDETGFLTGTYAGLTYAPRGQTPVIKKRMRHREQVTVLGSIAISPQRARCQLYAEFLQDRGVKYLDVLRHLRHIRRAVRTPLVIILDNLNIHKNHNLRNWAAKVKDVHLEYLPPYAPELNPVEAVWSHGKNVTAAGRLVADSEALLQLAHETVDAAAEQHLIRGFIRSTGLPISFDLHLRKRQSEPQ